jgi:hypothetical protein
VLDIDFHLIKRSGQVANDGEVPLGALVDDKKNLIYQQPTVNGKPTKSEFPEISPNPDYTSMLPSNGKLFSFVHFEGPLPSSLYLFELAQNAKDGLITAVKQKVVDWSKWGGLWLPCAGSVTPWGTHLGSEEYEPDAKLFGRATSLDTAGDATSLKSLNSGLYDNVVGFVRYFGLYYSDLTIAKAKAVFNPYKYGWITEMRANDDGSYTNVKHYTLGRKANEMADVMPDKRTVYIADDGTNVGFYKFIAKRAADLSEGTLYIAKFTQKGDPSGTATGAPETTGFKIEWIELASGKQAQIEKFINNDKLTFADIFDTATPNAAAPFCPAGFTSINAGDRLQECLKLKPGMAKAAAFLETRRYGAMMGGTTEFSKWEGMVINEAKSVLYASMSDVRQGMENNMDRGAASTKYDIGGPNDVRLTVNACGCVYALKYNRNYNINAMDPVVCGIPDTSVAGNTCSVNGIASPDNIALLPEQQILIIGEDTSGHQNDMIWAYDLEAEKLTRVATSPYGSEFTSVDWYEINGWGYLTSVVQHPYGESDQARIADGDSTGKAGHVGYYGPFRLSEIRGKSLQFAEIGYAATNSEKHNIRFSKSATASA